MKTLQELINQAGRMHCHFTWPPGYYVLDKPLVLPPGFNVKENHG